MLSSIVAVTGGVLLAVLVIRLVSRAKRSGAPGIHQVALLTAARFLAAFSIIFYLAAASKTLRSLFYIPMVALAVLLMALSLDWQRALVSDWLRRRHDPGLRRSAFWLIRRNMPYTLLLFLAVVIVYTCASRPLDEIAAGFVIGIAVAPIGWWFTAQEEPLS